MDASCRAPLPRVAKTLFLLLVHSWGHLSHLLVFLLGAGVQIDVCSQPPEGQVVNQGGCGKRAV